MLSACPQAMPRLVRLPLVALLVGLFAWAVQSARAEPLSIDTKTPQDLQIKVGAAELNVELSIHNSDEDEQLAFGKLLYKAGEQTSVGLASTRRGDNASPVLAKDTDAHYALSATLPDPGAYVGTLDILSADGKRVIHKIKLNVTREGQQVPTGLMVAPAAMTMTWPWSVFSPSETSIRLRNDTTKPVDVRTPSLLGFSNAAGAADISGVQLDTKGCPGPLLTAGASCAARVTFEKPLWPGTYALDIGVGGAAGGWSQQTLTVSAGLSIVVAFLVAAAGLWVGVLTDEWRKRGRPLVDSMIKLQTLKEAIDNTLLGPQGRPELKTAAELLKLDVGRWLERISDVPPDDAALTSLQTRFDRLIQAGRFLMALDKIVGDGKRILDRRVQALIEQLTDPQLSDAQAARLAASAKAVADDLDNWGKAAVQANLADAVEKALATLSVPRPTDADRAAIDAVRKPIAEARTAMLKPFAASLADADLADTVAKRTANLSDAIANAGAQGRAVMDKAIELLSAKIKTDRPELMDKLTALTTDWPGRLLALAAIWRDVYPSSATPMAQAVPAATSKTDGEGSGLAIGELHRDYVGEFWGLTAAQLRSRRADYEAWWNAAVVGLFALGLATASITPTWGSAADIAKLFLAGVGARLALAALTSK